MNAFVPAMDRDAPANDGLAGLDVKSSLSIVAPSACGKIPASGFRGQVAALSQGLWVTSGLPAYRRGEARSVPANPSIILSRRPTNGR